MRQSTQFDAFFIFFDANLSPFHRKNAIPLQPEFTSSDFLKQTTNEKKTTFPDEPRDAVGISGQCQEGTHVG